MRKKIVFVITVFILSTVLLHCQFIDLGDDPEKIKITSIKEIDIPEGLEFHSWSPKGNYFAFSTEEALKSYIFNKEGLLVKTVDGIMLDWSRDEKRVLCFTENFFIHSILSSEMKKIENIANSNAIQFGDENNLIYFQSFYEKSIMQTTIVVYDLNTGVKREMYRFKSNENKPYLPLQNDKNAFKFISNEKIFYFKNSQFIKDKKYGYDFCLLNTISGIEKVVYSGVSSTFSFYQLANGKNVFSISGLARKDATDYFVNDDGVFIGKIVDPEFQKLLTNNETIKWGETLTISNMNLLCNGKLIIVGEVTQYFVDNEDDGLLDQFLTVFNFKGKSQRLALPNPSRCIACSPTINVFLARIAITKPIINADHKSLVKQAKMAYRLITLGR